MKRNDLVRKRTALQEVSTIDVSDASVIADKPRDEVAKWMRVGVALLVLGVGGFFLWAATAPLDEGVPVQGSITVEGERKTVQPAAGGVVAKVHVKESQDVKKGDVLIELDDTQARANFELMRQTYLALRATEGRLLAEQRGASRIVFHPDLSKPDNALFARDFVDGQRQLFQTRRRALEGDIGILNEAAAGQQEAIKGMKAQLVSRQSQLALIREQLNGTRDMVKEGYLPRNVQLDQERIEADLNAVISDLQANIQRTERSVSELKLRTAQRREEYQREVETQLADVKRDVAMYAERLVSAREDLERMVIRSPADGQVVGLDVSTVGGVVSAGHTLMNIVPRGARMVLYARVPPQLIDSVHPGLKADVNFHGFVSQRYVTVEGEVLSVSADLVTEVPKPGQQALLPHYLARVGITPEGMKMLAGQQLQPGMPADVVIKTGERTMLTYLLRPLTQRIAVSMKEY